MRRLGAVSPNNYIFTDVAELDITNADAVMHVAKHYSIDAIINCAAYTNVDKAESDQATAELINATAVGNLARAMKEVGGTLFHVSTDYVFGCDGNTPRTEEMPLNPLGIYGLTKLHGEQAIEESGCKALIFRTAWLYSEFGNNFLKTMLRLTAEREQLNVVFDQVGTPTYAGDLALAIFSIIEAGVYEGNEGIYHFSNEGVCSWYDFAVEIAAAAGHTGCRINPCHSSEFPSPVTRPPYSVLDKTKIKNTFDIDIPHWRESMEYCIKRLKVNK
jgi:dTDP-4-dehydrorhamnose reductase